MTLCLHDGCREVLVSLTSLARGVLGHSYCCISRSEFAVETVKALGQGVETVTQTTAPMKTLLACTEDSSVDLSWIMLWGEGVGGSIALYVGTGGESQSILGGRPWAPKGSSVCHRRPVPVTERWRWMIVPPWRVADLGG